MNQIAGKPHAEIAERVACTMTRSESIARGSLRARARALISSFRGASLSGIELARMRASRIEKTREEERLGNSGSIELDNLCADNRHVMTRCGALERASALHAPRVREREN